MSPLFKTIYGFIQPAITGTSKVFRAIGNEKARSAVIKTLVGVVALGAFIRVMSKLMDEDEDKLIPDYSKNHKVTFAIGKGNQITLWNLPYGYSSFYALGNNIAEVAMGDKTMGEGTARVLDTAINSFSPFGTSLNNLTPTLAQPFYDVQNNTSWAGGTIRPDQVFDRTPEPNNTKYYDNAHGTFISLAAMLNRLSGGDEKYAGTIDYSPNDYQYVYQQFFGGPVEFMTSMVESGARAANGEFDPNKTPFVRKFFREGKPKQFAYETIYDTLGKAGKSKISDLEKNRFFDAVDLGEENRVFDADRKKNKKKADGYRRDFLKAIYNIDGAMDSPEAKRAKSKMTGKDRLMLNRLYKDNE
jgi:hypothetical protein